MTAEDVLFITLDSCRYDTFEAAQAPNLKSVAPLHRAQAPSCFTYGSHSAMFVGFTPGLAGAAQPFLDPKYGKLFKIVGAGHPEKATWEPEETMRDQYLNFFTGKIFRDENP